MIQEILELATRGYHLFPVGSHKRPATPNGHRDATTNQALLKKFFTGEVAFQSVGLACGESNLCVVDIDTKEGAEGYSAWVSLCDLYGMSKFPNTPIARTPSGGYHIYFRGLTSCSISKLAPMIDIKSRGGYVVCPPTPGYVWETFSPFDDEPIELPDWLGYLIAKTSRKEDPVPIEEHETISEGGRNAALVKFAGLMRRMGLGLSAIEDGLSAINMTLCDPPLSDNEVTKIAKSSQRWNPKG